MEKALDFTLISEGWYKNENTYADAVSIKVRLHSLVTGPYSKIFNYDQQVKMKVKDNLENTIYDILKDTTNVDEARNLINNNMYKINNSIKDILVSEKYNLDYDINFGKNYFPEKEYNGILYQEGYYESVLVTLGNGEGDNWWCVLFPPLCLLEAEESDEVEYKFFVQELIDKYF